jgi:hypothetical protein
MAYQVSLASARSKFERAEMHRNTLDHNLGEIVVQKANRVPVYAEIDADSGFHIFRIQSVVETEPILTALGLTIGDTIHNLQSAQGTHDLRSPRRTQRSLPPPLARPRRTGQSPDLAAKGDPAVGQFGSRVAGSMLACEDCGRDLVASTDGWVAVWLEHQDGERLATYCPACVQTFRPGETVPLDLEERPCASFNG